MGGEREVKGKSDDESENVAVQNKDRIIADQSLKFPVIASPA